MQTVQVPATNRCVLAATSLWILVLVMYASNLESLYMLCLLTVSVSHWIWHKHQGRLHYADVLLSSGLLLWVAFNTTEMHIWCLFAVMIVSLILGRWSLLIGAYSRHFLSHILFRYCAFWIVFTHVHAQITATGVFWYSTAYVLHILFTYCFANWLCLDCQNSRFVSRMHISPRYIFKK